MRRPAGLSDADWLRRNVRINPRTGCWEWQGARGRGGYGRCGNERAARVAYRAWRGPLASELEVCHTCDNPPCCNPDHLFLGTTQDNTADKVRKGRVPKGEQHPRARLRADDVRAIRADLRLHREIAADFGVKTVTVQAIKRRRIWAHLED